MNKYAWTNRWNERYSQNDYAYGYRFTFSIEEIKTDFADFDIMLLEEVEITLAEGIYHNGQGSVIRFVERKKKIIRHAFNT
jgi:hypothetical protein